MSQNWRTETNGEDYFGHQKKQLQIADRRPVIRKPSDLVGPGIAISATRITNFNNELAQFNGFYSALEGAAHAPTSDQAYMGWVTMDDEIGGIQMFFGMDDGVLHKRIFKRDPADLSTIHWGLWTTV